MLGIRLSTNAVERVVETLVALGGKDAGPSPDNAGGRRLDFGETWVDVFAGDVAGGRPGGGVAEVVLASTDPGLPAGGRVLDMALAHGAPIRLVRA